MKWNFYSNIILMPTSCAKSLVFVFCFSGTCISNFCVGSTLPTTQTPKHPYVKNFEYKSKAGINYNPTPRNTTYKTYTSIFLFSNFTLCGCYTCGCNRLKPFSARSSCAAACCWLQPCPIWIQILSPIEVLGSLKSRIHTTITTHSLSSFQSYQ